ncbi:uncharacterized protein A4U43_C03F3830 [Asparagus officinalis]|uniref:BHLH domain-containing protein n=1 Tax=Asparagus officinalis TaxID=4686 RepID=A0A5P1FCB5_ASPOF|nr:transcription factor AIG1-like [Asparagus officinalis]ONK74200.1 uncharacterized protein A4U43_C03F3830 [Asparagus officinalis]
MEIVDVGSLITEARSTVKTRAHRSHSEAERKRRQRINSHLATLRTIIPSAARMDKATLLGEVVRQVRELHEMTEDVAVVVPTEADGVHVEEEGGLVRAWICCPDRPGLLTDVDRAVGSVHARTVRAEISTIGGRTRSQLELESESGVEEDRSVLFAGLRSVLAGLVVGDQCKRQRL